MLASRWTYSVQPCPLCDSLGLTIACTCQEVQVLAEAEGIEPPSLLQPAAFKTVSSTNRTTSRAEVTGFEPASRFPDVLRFQRSSSTIRITSRAEKVGVEPTRPYGQSRLERGAAASRLASPCCCFSHHSSHFSHLSGQSRLNSSTPFSTTSSGVQANSSGSISSFSAMYPRWESNPQTLRFERSPYANSGTEASHSIVGSFRAASSAFTRRSASVVKLAVRPVNKISTASHRLFAGKKITVIGNATTYSNRVIQAHASLYCLMTCTNLLRFVLILQL